MTDEIQFHWPQVLQEAFEQAETGDQEAWARLYAAAAGFIREGTAIPSPLAEMISGRLQSIANVLLDPREKDKRAVLPDAVLTTAPRTQGRKGKDFADRMAEETLRLALYKGHAGAAIIDNPEKILMLGPEDTLAWIAQVVTLKDIDTAIDYLITKKMTNIPEHTLRANARKLRNSLRKRDK